MVHAGKRVYAAIDLDCDNRRLRLPVVVESLRLVLSQVVTATSQLKAVVKSLVGATILSDGSQQVVQVGRPS